MFLFLRILLAIIILAYIAYCFKKTVKFYQEREKIDNTIIKNQKEIIERLRRD